jgi:hypothetical protein
MTCFHDNENKFIVTGIFLPPLSLSLVLNHVNKIWFKKFYACRVLKCETKVLLRASFRQWWCRSLGFIAVQIYPSSSTINKVSLAPLFIFILFARKGLFKGKEKVFCRIIYSSHSHVFLFLLRHLAFVQTHAHTCIETYFQMRFFHSPIFACSRRGEWEGESDLRMFLAQNCFLFLCHTLLSRKNLKWEKRARVAITFLPSLFSSVEIQSRFVQDSLTLVVLEYFNERLFALGCIR